MSKRKWTDEQLIEAVKTSLSYAEVMRKLGLKAAQWLVDNGLAKTVNCKRHITDCCNHKITHAYGYIWKYGILPE